MQVEIIQTLELLAQIGGFYGYVSTFEIVLMDDVLLNVDEVELIADRVFKLLAGHVFGKDARDVMMMEGSKGERLRRHDDGGRW